MSEHQLKPCPFCGVLNGWVGTRDGHRVVRCSECGAAGPTAPKETAAVILWNTRACDQKPAMSIDPEGDRK